MTRNVAFADAIEVVAEICRRHQERHGHMPQTIVTVGGTALAAHGVRILSEDVDLYLEDIDDDIIRDVENTYVEKFGETFKIDATLARSIWGRFELMDIASSPIKWTIPVGEIDLEIRALDLVTLYCIKAVADREKDRDDRKELSKRVNLEPLLVRATTLCKWIGDRPKIPETILLLSSWISRDFGMTEDDVIERLAASERVKELIADLRSGKSRRTKLLIRAAITRNPELIQVVDGNPTFDIDSTLVSESLRSAIEASPDALNAILASPADNPNRGPR